MPQLDLRELRNLYQTYGNKWIELQAGPKSSAARQLQTALYLYEHNDPGTAFKWMAQSARSGNAEAQLNLALLYLKGEGCAPNPAEAQRWLESARKLGNMDARRVQHSYSVYGPRSLGPLALRKSLDVKVDAAGVERVAASLGQDQNDAKFYLGLGAMLKELAAGSRAPPSAHLLAAANNGHADAMFAMAWWYHHVSGQVETALELYKRTVAVRDLAYARYNLGLAYYDLGKWSHYSGEMSACANFHDYAPAKLHLGSELVQGRAISQNLQAGLLMVHSAAGQDLADAAMALARLHQEGVHTKKSARNAVFWYEKAAKLGKRDALYHLSVMFDPCTKRGSELLAQAAKAGVVLAQNDYGTMLAKAGDFKAALHWLRLAAAKGDKTAAKNITLLQRKLDDSLPPAPIAGLAVTA